MMKTNWIDYIYTHFNEWISEKRFVIQNYGNFSATHNIYSVLHALSGSMVCKQSVMMMYDFISGKEMKIMITIMAESQLQTCTSLEIRRIAVEKQNTMQTINNVYININGYTYMYLI